MEIEVRKIIEKINNSKNCFFKRMDNIDTLVRLAKKKNYQYQEKVKNMSETEHIKMTVWNCY